jgi:hypothetical protein
MLGYNLQIRYGFHLSNSYPLTVHHFWCALFLNISFTVETTLLNKLRINDVTTTDLRPVTLLQDLPSSGAPTTAGAISAWA